MSKVPFPHNSDALSAPTPIPTKDHIPHTSIKNYTTTLIIDNREIRFKHDRTYFQDELAKRGIMCLTRPMAVGDMTWVAVSNDTGVKEEVMLDYIVERKRLDDLVSSIKDGRFREQKHRLASCGVRNVVYLVEDYNLVDASMFFVGGML